MASRSRRTRNRARPRPDAGACAFSATGTAQVDHTLAALLTATTAGTGALRGNGPAPRHAVLHRLEQLACTELAQARRLPGSAEAGDSLLDAYVGWDLDAPAG